MERDLFIQIVEKVNHYDPAMRPPCDTTGMMTGLSCLLKGTAALRFLAYGFPADAMDEYVRIGEKTALLYLDRFCEDIRAIYGNDFLRTPDQDEVRHYLDINDRRGWPSMFGSIDCMHWVWKNCPTAWAGEYLDRQTFESVTLEAVATPDFRIGS
jgi:hypothetical protein